MNYDIRWIEVDDQVVVYCSSRQGFVELDRSGAELWHALAGGNWEVGSLASYLCDVHLMDSAAASSLVHAFIDDLARHGVEIVPEGPGSSPH